jgi:hypothetical protein
MWAIPCACISERWHSVQHHAAVSRLTGRRDLVVIESFVSVATSKFLWKPWRQYVISKCQYKALPPMNCRSRRQDLGSRAALPAARAIPSFFLSRQQQPHFVVYEDHHVFVTCMLKCLGHCLLSDFDFLLEKYAHLNQNWSGIEQHASCVKLTHLA